MTLLLGAHTINNGGIDMAALRAGNADMSALQIFPTIPKYYGDKQSIRPERVERFKAALTKAGIAPENVVVHSVYVLNTASKGPITKKQFDQAIGGVGGSANGITHVKRSYRELLRNPRVRQTRGQHRSCGPAIC